MSSIIICGITPMEAYPKGISVKHCKQCVEKIELCIPSVKPDVEEPNEIHINICVEKVKMIDTVLGPKLIIDGKIRVKLIYTANNKVQSVHSAHWEKIFCNYILLKDLKGIVSNVFVGVEDVCVTCVGERDLSIAVIFILCPKVCEDNGENQTCYCIKNAHFNRLQVSDMLINSETKVIEYTNNAPNQMTRKKTKYEYEEDRYREQDRYKEQDKEDRDRYYGRRTKTDNYNLYKNR